MDEDLFKYMQRLLDSSPEAVGPVELTPQIQDTATVIDGTKKKKKPESIKQMGSAIRSALLGSSFTRRPAPEKRVPRGMEVNNSPLIPDQNDQVVQLLKGMNSGDNLAVTPDNLSVDQKPRTVQSGGFIKPTDEQKDNPVGRNTNVPNINAGNLDLSQFAGSKIQGITPVGTPEPEEISGLSKALNSFSKALETPGFQRFLSQMGIAFSGGRPNEPGTILGQFNINQLDSDLENKIVKGLSEGKSLSEIDLPETPSSEIINRAMDRVMQQRDLSLKERQIANQERGTKADIRQKDAAFEYDKKYNDTRLRQIERGLDIKENSLNLERAKLMADTYKETKPDEVSVGEWGIALDAIAQKYLPLAKEARRADLEAQGISPTLTAIQEAFSNEKTGFDANAVLNYLSPDQLNQALTDASKLSQQLNTSFNTGQTLDFTNKQQQVGSRDNPISADQVAGIPQGSTFWAKDPQSGEVKQYIKLEGTKAKPVQ